MRVSLESVVPGWKHELIPEAVEKVASGHAREVERLRGSRYALVHLAREYDYDGLTEKVELLSGFAELEEAKTEAGALVEQLAAKAIAANPGPPAWRYLGSEAPSLGSILSGAIYAPVIKVGDGSGFNSIYSHVAVLPLDPRAPLGLAFVEGIGRDWELARHFMNIAATAT